MARNEFLILYLGFASVLYGVYEMNRSILQRKQIKFRSFFIFTFGLAIVIITTVALFFRIAVSPP